MVTWSTRPPFRLLDTASARSTAVPIQPFFSSLHFFLTGVDMASMLRTLTGGKTARCKADRAAIRIRHPLPGALAGLSPTSVPGSRIRLMYLVWGMGRKNCHLPRLPYVTSVVRGGLLVVSQLTAPCATQAAVKVPRVTLSAILPGSLVDFIKYTERQESPKTHYYKIRAIGHLFHSTILRPFCPPLTPSCQHRPLRIIIPGHGEGGPLIGRDRLPGDAVVHQICAERQTGELLQLQGTGRCSHMTESAPADRRLCGHPLAFCDALPIGLRMVRSAGLRHCWDSRETETRHKYLQTPSQAFEEHIFQTPRKAR
ncbi:hypothetical protein KC325_g140 [Hortaea werneckii]|nr:hypothetical protein KC325_g140 [Hortaea werneckii]